MTTQVIRYYKDRLSSSIVFRFAMKRLVLLLHLVVLLLVLDPVRSHQSLVRRRRFASLIKYFNTVTKNDNEAPSKVVEEEYIPADPYGSVESDIKGHSRPFLSKILQWDDRPDHLGPLLSRLVQLTKDLMEDTDVVQSVVMRDLGMGEEVYTGKE